MTNPAHSQVDLHDVAPGDEHYGAKEILAGIRGYIVGLGLALFLTAMSFAVVLGGSVWQPGIPAALAALAIAQMGVHLVFFLHINSGPDSTNNILALVFGTIIVTLVIGGSLWIMANLNTMLPGSPGSGHMHGSF